MERLHHAEDTPVFSYIRPALCDIGTTLCDVSTTLCDVSTTLCDASSAHNFYPFVLFPSSERYSDTLYTFDKESTGPEVLCAL